MSNVKTKNKVKTSIVLTEELHRNLKILTSIKGISVNKYLSNLIEADFKKNLSSIFEANK